MGLSQECGSLLQIRPPKFTHFNVIILQNFCMFLASLVNHQGVQMYKTIGRYAVLSNIWQCGEIIKV